MSDYYVILTDAGQALMAAATAGGDPVVLSQFGVDDGNGAAFTPDPAQTALINEVYRGDISGIQATGNTIKSQLVIPKDSGGYTVRGFGLYTADGTLFSVCNFPAQEKPLPDSGYAVKMDTDYYLQVTDTSLVQLQFSGDDYLTREEADTIYLQIANNLSEIKAGGGDAQAAARVNIGCGTAAAADVTEAVDDTTAGRLLKVGDYGLSRAILVPTGTDVANFLSTASGSFYHFDNSSDYTNAPAFGSWFDVYMTIHETTGYRTIIAVNSAGGLATAGISDDVFSGWLIKGNASDYLPLSGGEITGSLYVDNALGVGTQKKITLSIGSDTELPAQNITMRNWGHSNDRPTVFEIGDETAYLFYAQRNTDGSVVISSAGIFQPSDYSNFDSRYISGIRLANYGSTYGNLMDSAQTVMTGIHETNGYDNVTTHEHRQVQYAIAGSWYNAPYV